MCLRPSKPGVLCATDAAMPRDNTRALRQLAVRINSTPSLPVPLRLKLEPAPLQRLLCRQGQSILSEASRAMKKVLRVRQPLLPSARFVTLIGK